MAEGGEGIQQAAHVRPAGAVDRAGDLLDDERPVGVVHDGTDGLCAVFEGRRPGERFGRGGARGGRPGSWPATARPDAGAGALSAQDDWSQRERWAPASTRRRGYRYRSNQASTWSTFVMSWLGRLEMKWYAPGTSTYAVSTPRCLSAW